MADTKGKPAVIVLSSEDEDEEGNEDEADDDDDDDDDPDEEVEYSDRNDEVSESVDSDEDDESLSRKIVALLQEGSDIESLKLKECKAYLRKHGLRLAGNRAVCVDRIREHWRLKDGHGFVLYPRSSFIINCTGDVCKGDVVLFRQKVYEKFDKVTQHGKLLGNRTVAGRVVKESYGAAKQQHTFTVEVLWISGIRKLPPLFPLLVKGRNLYKQKTYRQRWKNEADRVMVLAEKHRRGAAARLVRAARQKKQSCYANGSKGTKRQHEVQNTKRSKIGRSCEVDKVRHLNGRQRAVDFQPQQDTSSKQATWKGETSSRAFRSSREWHKSAEFDHCQVPSYPLYSCYGQRSYQSQVNSQGRNEPNEFFYYERGLIPNTTGYPPVGPHVSKFTHRSPQLVSRDSHLASANLRYNFEMKDWNAENVGRPLQLSRGTRYGYRNYEV